MNDYLFTLASISFLRKLKKNNDRDWFEAHRAEYEALIKEPCRAFIDQIKRPLLKLFPDLKIDYRSISRINRDTRFLPNKDPYKTWVAFLFRDLRLPKEESPALYLGFDPSGLAFGCGYYEFPKPVRDYFRTQISEKPSDRLFTRSLAKPTRAGYEPLGKLLKRLPPGFDPAHPNAEFLPRNGLYLSQEMNMPKEFYGPKFPEYALKKLAPCAEFFDWMRKMGKGAPSHPSRFLGAPVRSERLSLMDEPG